MNPRTPLTVLAALFALVGMALFVLYRRNRATLEAHTSERAFGVLRYSVPSAIVLYFLGGLLSLGFAGRFDRWPSPVGSITPSDVSQVGLVVWFLGTAALSVSLVVLIASTFSSDRSE